MPTTDPSALEANIDALRVQGDSVAAVTALVEGYGAELLSFLSATLRSHDEACDAFQTTCEEIWKSLPKFRGQASYRTWAFAIARNVGRGVMRDPRRKPERNVRLSVAPEVQNMVDHVRTTTQQHLRSEVKDRVAELRQNLGEQDRALLVLRVNRGMSWSEIAYVLAEEELDAAALKKRSAALRQQFQRAKQQLRRLVVEDGLVQT